MTSWPPSSQPRSQLSVEVRQTQGRQLAMLLGRLLTDDLYQDEADQFLVVNKALADLSTRPITLVDTGKSVRIVEFIECLATEESHHGTWKVRLSDGVLAVVKTHGYEREGGEPEALRGFNRALKRHRTEASLRCVEPLAWGVRQVQVGGQPRNYRFLLTKFEDAPTLAMRESPASAPGVAGSVFDSADSVQYTMYQAALVLHDVGATVGKQTAAPWSRRMSYHQRWVLPSLMKSRLGHLVPDHLGTLLHFGGGDDLVDVRGPYGRSLGHADLSSTNILIPRYEPDWVVSTRDGDLVIPSVDKSWIILDPRGAVQLLRETDIAQIAVTTSIASNVDEALAKAIRRYPDLRASRLDAAAASFSVTMAGWVARHNSVLRATDWNEESFYRDRVERALAVIMREDDPVIRSAALQTFDERVRPLLSLSDLRRKASVAEIEGRKYLILANELADRAFGSDFTMARHKGLLLPGRARRGNPNRADQRLRAGSIDGPSFPRYDEARTHSPHPPGELPPEEFRLKPYRISVVVPVTRLHTLPATLRSIAAQKDDLPPNAELEIVLMPDGKDVGNLRHIVDEARLHAPAVDIKLLPGIPRKGHHPAFIRNHVLTSLDGITGHLVRFVDDDDVLPPGALAAQFRPFLRQAGLGWSAGRVTKWFSSDEDPTAYRQVQAHQVEELSTNAPQGLVTPLMARRLVDKYGYFPTWPQGAMYRTDLLRALAGESAFLAGEDVARNTMAAMHAPGWVIDERVYYLRQQGDSLTRRADWKEVVSYQPEQLRAMVRAVADIRQAGVELGPLWTADGSGAASAVPDYASIRAFVGEAPSL